MLCPGHIQLLAVAAYKVQKGRIVFVFFHSIGKNGVNKTRGQVVPLVTSQQRIFRSQQRAVIGWSNEPQGILEGSWQCGVDTIMVVIVTVAGLYLLQKEKNHFSSSQSKFPSPLPSASSVVSAQCVFTVFQHLPERNMQQPLISLWSEVLPWREKKEEKKESRTQL